MSELTKNQLILICDLRDDIDFYKTELDNQIKTHRILLSAAISIAVILGILSIVFPSLLISLQSLSDKIDLGTISGLATEVIPITLASKSFTKVNSIKKKKDGLRIFLKDINRMEQGILPNKNENILSLEQELILYINT